MPLVSSRSSLTAKILRIIYKIDIRKVQVVTIVTRARIYFNFRILSTGHYSKNQDESKIENKNFDLCLGDS